MSSPWPATADAMIGAQQELASAQPEPWRPGEVPRAVAGCFVCFQRGRAGPGKIGDPGWAAGALLDAAGASIAVIHERATAPYVPGLLALRDGPLLEAAVRRLPARPEVLLVNATGRDHPRRAGLALHLDAVLDVPTIGVTTEPLLAQGDQPAEARGSRSVLRIGDEVVACWLRLRGGVRPLVVHPGWRTDLETAVAVVTAVTRDARTPEPMREARRAAREARAATTTGA